MLSTNCTVEETVNWDHILRHPPIEREYLECLAKSDSKGKWNEKAKIFL